MINAYASTELGASNILIKKDPEDWPWHLFHPHYNGFEFREVSGESDLHELFVHKVGALPQQLFCIFPHLEEWPMKDLFRRHPTKPHLWRLEGRSDDLIVLSDGCKINPVAIETAIREAPGVRDVLILGSKRHRPAAIIEPASFEEIAKADKDIQNDFIDKMWPFVESCNKTFSASAQLARELIMIAKPDKPFPRSGKRTVQRGASLHLYTAEIDKLYENLPVGLKEAKELRIG